MSNREKKAKRRRERLKRRRQRECSSNRATPHHQQMSANVEANLVGLIGELLLNADLSPPQEIRQYLSDLKEISNPLCRLVFQLFDFLHGAGKWPYTPGDLLGLEVLFVRYRGEKLFARLLALSLANVPELISCEVRVVSWFFGKKFDNVPLSRRVVLYFREYPEALWPFKLFLAGRYPLPKKYAKEAAEIAGRAIFAGALFEPSKIFSQGLAHAISLADLSNSKEKETLEVLNRGARQMRDGDDAKAGPMREFFRTLFASRRFQYDPAKLFVEYPFLANRMLGISSSCLEEADITEFLRRHGRMMPNLALRVIKTRFDPEPMKFENRLRYEAIAVRLLEKLILEEKAKPPFFKKIDKDLIREMFERFSTITELFEREGASASKIEVRFIAFFVRMIFSVGAAGEGLSLVAKLLLRHPGDFRLRLLSIMGTREKYPDRAERFVDRNMPELLSHVDPVLFSGGVMPFLKDVRFLVICRDLLYRHIGKEQRTEFLLVLLDRIVNGNFPNKVFRSVFDVFSNEEEFALLSDHDKGKGLIAGFNRRLNSAKKSKKVRRKNISSQTQQTENDRQGVLF